jgi:hypothetical protein
MLQGEGTMADPTGVQVYTGGWLADARCGYAVFTYEGGKYEGGWCSVVFLCFVYCVLCTIAVYCVL